MPAPSIRIARSECDIALARALFEEYAAALGVDLCFQGFADELATLPGKYGPPMGTLLLAGPPGDAVGCIALRPLPPPPPAAFPPPVGEVKRLYMKPRARGNGTGRALVVTLVDAARAFGYRTLCLDTLERMSEARALYESVGFVRCARYYDNPLDDAVYYSRSLVS
ncbi:amino-acid N-acetyltransferase [Burkholderiales bacterium]|nr:amino-acid N-acetyltransferase [Burkholderiales bacterium]